MELTRPRILRIRANRDFNTGTIIVHGWRRDGNFMPSYRRTIGIPEEVADDILASSGRSGLREKIAEIKSVVADSLTKEGYQRYETSACESVLVEPCPLNPSTCLVSPSPSQHRPPADGSASPNGADSRAQDK